MLYKTFRAYFTPPRSPAPRDDGYNFARLQTRLFYYQSRSRNATAEENKTIKIKRKKILTDFIISCQAQLEKLEQDWQVWNLDDYFEQMTTAIYEDGMAKFQRGYIRLLTDIDTGQAIFQSMGQSLKRKNSLQTFLA